MVLWPFFDDDLLYSPGTAEAGSASATIHKAIVTVSCLTLPAGPSPISQVLPLTCPENHRAFPKVRTWRSAETVDRSVHERRCEPRGLYILCLSLARVATESRVPIK